MSNTQIKEQVRTIKRATDNAAKSKEKALQFLKDAGIIQSPATAVPSPKKK